MSSQRNSRGGGAGSRQQNHRRRAGGRGRRGPRFTGARLGLGVLCILAALGLVYRSVLAGVFKEGAGIGMPGLIPAVLFFFGGVMAIQMRHRAAPVAFLTPFLFCLLADITCLIHASKMNEWKLWAVAAAALAILFLVFLCLHRQRGLTVPVVLLVVTVVLTAVVCLLVKGSAAQGNGTQTQSSDGTATDGTQTGTDGTDSTGADGTAADGTAAGSETGTDGTTTDASQSTDASGTLNLVTDSFTLKYVRHEMGEDVNGSPCVYVYYDFTNNSDQAVSIPSVSYTKLTQNGSECGKASVAEMNDEMNNYKTEVQPGATVTACEVYSVSDTSDALLEAVEFVPTNAKSASMTLTLE